MNNFLIVDGNSIACRGAFAKPTLINSKGRETGGTLRFFYMLDKVMKSINATHLVIAFDVSKNNFRKQIDENYKSNRTVKSPSLYDQFNDIKEILNLINIKYVGIEGYEADDIIGSFSSSSMETNNYIFSGDKDVFQLVSENTFVIYPQTGASEFKIIKTDNFKEFYNVEINQFVELKALMGDDSDNIKGVPNCGLKNAEKILNKYGSINNAEAKKEEITGKLGENFRSWLKDKDKTLQLVTIKKDISLPYSYKECEIDIKWEKCISFLEKLECFSLVKRIKEGKMHNVNK